MLAFTVFTLFYFALKFFREIRKYILHLDVYLLSFLRKILSYSLLILEIWYNYVFVLCYNMYYHIRLLLQVKRIKNGLCQTLARLRSPYLQETYKNG